jgi:hypothetical protein
MKTRNEIREKELEMSKNYTAREVKMSIKFYKAFRFLFSDVFSFLFSLAIFVTIAYTYDFKMSVCFGLLIVHPIYFFFIDKNLEKLFNTSEYKKELDTLIEVNYEILENKKREVK